MFYTKNINIITNYKFSITVNEDGIPQYQFIADKYIHHIKYDKTNEFSSGIEFTAEVYTRAY